MAALGNTRTLYSKVIFKRKYVDVMYYSLAVQVPQHLATVVGVLRKAHLPAAVHYSIQAEINWVRQRLNNNNINQLITGISRSVLFASLWRKNRLLRSC